MFIGKSICIGAVGAITGICLLLCLDKKVKLKNKAAMVLLTLGIIGIVFSL